MAAKNNSHHEVPARLLRWQCDPSSLRVKSTSDITSNKEIIGQERALRALRLGLELKQPGYNVFVTGFSGTGRMTTIKRLLAEFSGEHSGLKDRCYVHNFRNPDLPILLTFKAGVGNAFRDDMDNLVQELVKNIPAVFESKRYQEERKRQMELFQERQRSILKEFERKVKEKNFEVIQVQAGTSIRPDITPVVNNEPVSYDQLDTLVKEGKITKEQVEQFMNDRTSLESQMELVLREMRNIEKKAKSSIDELAEKFILPAVKDSVDKIRAEYDDVKVQQYLDEVQENIMDDLNRFRPQEEGPASIIGAAPQLADIDELTEFQVNVVVDNSDTKKIPIVIETNPRYKNIFGTIERQVDRNGVWRTDFTLIKAGSLLQADGGYLVINALDALMEQGVWQNLKRTLRYGQLEIQTLETGLFGTSSALKPESIEIDVKVVMIGDAHIYSLLYEQDDDFKKIFKVRADFDIVMPRVSASIERYTSFIKMICEDDKLLPFDSAGISAVIEYGVRLAGRQDKLSTRFNIIADVLREASYWAGKEKCTIATDKHILKAISERIERVKLVEEKIQEMMLDGTIMIDTEGAVVGQVNGLSVYDMGEYMFGKPSRITARTSLGRDGVINIERESDMSGPTHNKGVLILGGFLRGLYATNKPLVMNASLTFEQSYSGVDGDSASSTEVYAILSSLANVPLRQDLAVTGSVNQNGEIQPIGGVNQKIEGFFDVCNARGLTGTQGVMIPFQNQKELMLRQDVVEAVKKGKFHIYAIKHIDEGIEILTGIKAGKRLKSGSFEQKTIHSAVDQTLTKYASRWKELSD